MVAILAMHADGCDAVGAGSGRADAWPTSSSSTRRVYTVDPSHALGTRPSRSAVSASGASAVTNDVLATADAEHPA